MRVQRQLIHTRTIQYRGYKRDDGLWDMEGKLQDVRHYPTRSPEIGELEPGEAIHSITVRVTLDDALTIRAIDSRFVRAPFQVCSDARSTLQRLVGLSIAAGWRKSLSDLIGGELSCTHLRELLANMGTATLQTIPIFRAQTKRHGLAEEEDKEAGAPFFLGKCYGWKLDGYATQRFYPQWFAEKK